MNCYQKFYTNQIHSSSLLCQLATMWKSQVLCDAIIKSGSINIKAHRVVLVAACPMLQSMENAAVGSHLEVRLASDIKQESINTFLQYLYEGFMLLTEENCKDVEKIGRLLQVDSVIKCCADFFKCLSSKTGLVDLNEQYRYTNYQDVEFKHVRSSHIQKTLQEKSLKRGIDVVRPASPSSKRHRYHNADDTFSMSQSYNVTDPWERVPRAGAPSHRQSSSQPGVIDVVEDSLELVQTDPPGSTNSATNRQANNKSVSISVSSQLNRDSNVQVVNVPDANKKQNDQSNKQSQQHNNQNQSVASPLTALCEMSSPNNDSPLHRAPDITAGTLKKQMPSPMHSHSAITHSMPSPHSIDSSFPSPQSYDTSQQSSHQSRPVPVAKPFAAGSASQTGPLFSMMATSSSMPSPSSLRRSESQSSTGSKDTDRPAVDTGQTTGSVASPSESKVNEENIADLNIVKIESDDSNTGGLDMYVDTNEDGIVKLTRNTDDDLDDTSATDQSYDWTRERMEGGLEGNQTWFAGQTQGHWTEGQHLQGQVGNSSNGNISLGYNASNPLITKNLRKDEEEEILILSKNCVSRQNFAWKLTKFYFSNEELKDRNCYGRKGKKALNENKLELIYHQVFRYFPVQSSRQAENAWRQCTTSIDQGLRNIIRKQNQAKLHSLPRDPVKIESLD